MTTAIALAVLALVDCILSGFRVAAGRDGRLDKRDYYLHATARAAAWGLALVAAHAALAAALSATSADPAAAWDRLVDAARPLVVVYGCFAALTFLAFGFYFAPVGDFRVLTNVIVFGPLTLARRAVIVGGMLYAAARAPSVPVGVLALSAALSMSSFEAFLGRRYADRWRSLVADPSSPEPLPRHGRA